MESVNSQSPAKKWLYGKTSNQIRWLGDVTEGSSGEGYKTVILDIGRLKNQLKTLKPVNLNV